MNILAALVWGFVFGQISMILIYILATKIGKRLAKKEFERFSKEVQP